MSQDLATLEGAEAFAQAALAHARTFFEKNGWHPIVAHLLCTRGRAGFSLKGGEIGIQTVVPDSMPNTATKNGFAEFLEKRIVEARAIGIVFVSEAWMLATEDARDRPESLESHPRRTEGIFVLLEHIRTTAIWRALITRDADGQGTLGEFRRGKANGLEGRFVNLLHRERFS